MPGAYGLCRETITVGKKKKRIERKIREKKT
jgi:hypothetical protein